MTDSAISLAVLLRLLFIRLDSLVRNPDGPSAACGYKRGTRALALLVF